MEKVGLVSALVYQGVVVELCCTPEKNAFNEILNAFSPRVYHSSITTPRETDAVTRPTFSNSATTSLGETTLTRTTVARKTTTPILTRSVHRETTTPSLTRAIISGPKSKTENERIMIRRQKVSVFNIFPSCGMLA